MTSLNTSDINLVEFVYGSKDPAIVFGQNYEVKVCVCVHMCARLSFKLYLINYIR